MGNGAAKLTLCFTGEKLDFPGRRSPPVADENLGHSFCYLRPDRIHSSRVHSEDPSSSAFRLSGASISANTATALTAGDHYSGDRSSAFFESSTSFASIPLQLVPRGSISGSGPLVPGSGPLERGFLSGPIERGFLSGPLDRVGIYSGPLDNSVSGENPNFLRRSFSHGFKISGSGQKPRGIIRVLRRAISKTLPRHWQSNSVVAPVKNGVKDPEWGSLTLPENLLTVSSSEGSVGLGLEEEKSQKLQWAQGRAGEDRVHVVVSEEFGWVFVGIYDGFNGPDAPDFLLTNLYGWVHKELKGLLWDDDNSVSSVSGLEMGSGDGEKSELEEEKVKEEKEKENYLCPSGENSGGRRKRGRKGKCKGGVGKNQRRWKCEWVRERIELDNKLKEQWNRLGSGLEGGREQDHKGVLDALSRALRRTEEAYLDVADRMVAENPELALMGSCVLVMLMKGEDVYVMNVGDSRAVLAQKPEPDYGVGKIGQDLERINEETTYDLEDFDGDGLVSIPKLNASQLTVDHSTSVEEEVRRIKREHPDDAHAVMNDRVKGSLKVTRAFGAGFLKQPKWNNALLEMFRIDYIGNSPYLSCSPFLHHHRLGPNDRFLILSSDGLYQYLTNEEAVNEVELFITLQPEGDPAQHLVEEVLFRAAKKAGMDFHELLEIPHGDRRRYHDDISIIVISLEGRIWRSCV